MFLMDEVRSFKECESATVPMLSFIMGLNQNELFSNNIQ